MFSKDFLNHLEYHITAALEEFSKNDERLKGYWCDGVMECAETVSHKQIHADGRVILKAFVGKSGQEEYTLILTFDNAAKSHIEEYDLLNYIPVDEVKNWFNIDLNNKMIEIRFNGERYTGICKEFLMECQP